MLPLTIKKRRFLRKSIHRQLPEKWNELSQKQLLTIVTLLHSPLSELLIRYRLLCGLLGLSAGKVHNWFNSVQIAQLLNYTKFIFNDISLTKQLLPVIKLKLLSFQTEKPYIRIGRASRLYGPGDRLKNITYDELIFADGLFLDYFHSKRISSLNSFVAVLYRPKRNDSVENGDSREPFNRHTIESRASAVGRMRLKHKLAIYFFYQGCRRALVSSYPEIFSGSEADAMPVNPWLEMARHIPNDKFGTISQIMNLDIHFVLLHMNGAIKDAKEKPKYSGEKVFE